MKQATRVFFSITMAVILLYCTSDNQSEREYKAEFASLEQINPVPEWFKDAKFGIYFHWGAYAVPAFANEWYPRTMYMDGTPENLHHTEVYGSPAEWPYNYFITGAKDKEGNFVQFAPKLKSQGGNFDPAEWAQLFHDAGARFAGPVAEHHDGFSLWASEVNPWNSKDLGPKLDLVGLFTDAIREKNMKVFLSMHHAFHITGYYEAVPKTDDPELQMLYGQMGKEKNEALWLAKHKEIIDLYQPDIIYQDFNLHLITDSVLLGFLSYYYNSAEDWNKDVVATFKDGLNEKCAVLDYERGGPPDITGNYWLTDDAISSSSWCYTEGIEYYSVQQILHAFLDRISKNGNMILNISPMPDGSIPEEQKEILRGMGQWLKRYGEAVYATRAWHRYGEGPTEMGGAHGIMGEPVAGTAADIRYTRSKDNSTLYAIMLGWDKGMKEIVLRSLSSNRIDLKNLKSVELINGNTGSYMALDYDQTPEGLIVQLPDHSFDEPAYVIKLNFRGKMQAYDPYVEFNSESHYHLVPALQSAELVVGKEMVLTPDKKEPANQWKLESEGIGFYRIRNRENPAKVIAFNEAGRSIELSEDSGEDNQVWKIDDAHNGHLRIYNKRHPYQLLSPGEVTSGEAASKKWRLLEVCELKQEPYRKHIIPGTIQAEDFDAGCPDDAYNDRDPQNIGRDYRPSEGVDIEAIPSGGFNVGWTAAGEWLAYTVSVKETGTYRVVFHIASSYDEGKLHLESGGRDLSGIVTIPNTKGFQIWDTVSTKIRLEAGDQVLKVIFDGNFVNLDKMEFIKL